MRESITKIIVLIFLSIFQSGFVLSKSEVSIPSKSEIIKISVLVDASDEAEMLNLTKSIQNAFASEMKPFFSRIPQLAPELSIMQIDEIQSIGELEVEPSTMSDNFLHDFKPQTCSMTIEGSLIVVLVSTRNNRNGPPTQTFAGDIAKTLGYYEVPVVNVGSRSVRQWDSNSPSAIHVLPPWHAQAEILARWLNKLEYNIVSVLSTDTADSVAFLQKLHQKLQSLKIKVQTNILVETNQNWTMYRKEFYEATTNVWVMDAEPATAERAFNTLTQHNPVWVTTERVLGASNVPLGTLSLKMKYQDHDNSIRVAFQSINTMLRNKVNISVNEPLGSPETFGNCKDRARQRHDDMTSRFLNLKNFVVERQDYSGVAYDSNGQRRLAAYDLVNVQPGVGHQAINKQVVVGIYRVENANARYAEMILEESDPSKIVWPLGASMKPSAVSLPKNLKIIAVPDAPFIYRHRMGHTKGCNLLNNEAPVIEGIVIKNATWIRCTKDHDLMIESTFCCTGLAVELITAIQHNLANLTLHFNYTLHMTRTYGALNLSSGQWTGMVGRLERGESDAAIGALSISDERQAVIDFSIPWLYHGITILERTRPRMSPMESFLQPFKPQLWASLFLTVLAVGAAMFLLDRNSPFERFKSEKTKAEEDDNEKPLGLAGAMWFVWGVLLDSGIGERSPRGMAARVLGMAWCGFSMIMVASYTANLAAFLVLDQPARSLTGITDTRLRNPSANFTFATVADSNTHQYFKRHIELQTMARMMESENFATAKEGIKALNNGSLDAFIWDSTYLDFEAAKSCRLSVSGGLFGQGAYGVALQKGSPWTRIFSLSVLSLIEDGTLEKLEERWISDLVTVENKRCESVDRAPTRLGLTNMKDGFILVSAGILLGLIGCLIERRVRLRSIKQQAVEADSHGDEQSSITGAWLINTADGGTSRESTLLKYHHSPRCQTGNHYHYHRPLPTTSSAPCTNRHEPPDHSHNGRAHPPMWPSARNAQHPNKRQRRVHRFKMGCSSATNSERQAPEMHPMLVVPSTSMNHSNSPRPIHMLPNPVLYEQPKFSPTAPWQLRQDLEQDSDDGRPCPPVYQTTTPNDRLRLGPGPDTNTQMPRSQSDGRQSPLPFYSRPVALI